MRAYPSIEDTVGHTPLVRLLRLNPNPNSVVLAKLEGNNPAGSVKDRPAFSMFRHAEARGEIKPGDTLIEATSGNTGIALAMAAATRGYHMVLVMPEDLSVERRQSMQAFGARIVLTHKAGGMEHARDVAEAMQRRGEGKILDQFANNDNPRAHIESTGPEIWEQTGGEITHFVSSMGTTGTITGTGSFLKQKNPAIRVVGLQPQEGSRIAGIRKWSAEYVPSIYRPEYVDELRYIAQYDAEFTMRELARREGIFAGVSAGGAVYGALQLARENDHATIVVIIPDRGDRYLSTGLFNPELDRHD